MQSVWCQPGVSLMLLRTIRPTMKAVLIEKAFQQLRYTFCMLWLPGSSLVLWLSVGMELGSVWAMIFSFSN